MMPTAGTAERATTERRAARPGAAAGAAVCFVYVRGFAVFDEIFEIRFRRKA
jgi:hypothetical protein